MHNSICHDWVTSGSINSQPDITISVGNVQQAVKFMAHKFVLSSYSGYFKTLFASYDGVEAHISNIGSHTFAYLLSFMYTSHLELNPFNVYEIFAASSWLQMTEVLELCQQYFIRKHYTTSLLQSSVVKPIPRRHVAVVSLNDQESSRFLKYQPLRLHSESSSIFKPVRIEESHQSQPAVIEEGDSEELDIVEGEARNSNDQTQPTTSTTSDDFKASCAPSDKVVLDIACCDGPIKFHRVTNQFYNPEKAMTTSAKEDVTASTCHKCNQAFSNELQQRFSLSGCQFSDASTTNRQTDPSIPSADSNADTKKKVENLQCYSCKTCGSKFPSYYFVHKHRKLHHQDTKEFLE